MQPCYAYRLSINLTKDFGECDEDDCILVSELLKWKVLVRLMTHDILDLERVKPGKKKINLIRQKKRDEQEKGYRLAIAVRSRGTQQR